MGIGAKVATIAQTFSQGNITQTNNPLDIAINGQGFFRMSDGGAISYSRDGQFRADGNGFITNSRGLNLTGYMADASGNIIASGPTNLKLSTSDLAPKPTSSYAVGVNLDSRLDLPAVATFDATNPQSYNKTTSGTVVDSLGNSHQFALFFQKTAANTWNTFATIDGKVDAAGLPIGVTLGGAASQALQFDSTGAIDPAATPFTVSIDLATINPTLGATSPLDFTLDLTSSTQFGSDFGVNALTQDGYAPGRLAGFSTTADGIIQGNYTNGQTKTIGQIVLANFFNPQGLAPAGDGRWEETADSGQPVVGTPKSGTLGALQSSAVEDANVDLTHELVKMITAQRMYQANAKTIETQDTVLQTLVNL